MLGKGASVMSHNGRQLTGMEAKVKVSNRHHAKAPIGLACEPKARTNCLGPWQRFFHLPANGLMVMLAALDRGARFPPCPGRANCAHLSDIEHRATNR
jgi:hypothetical protein